MRRMDGGQRVAEPSLPLGTKAPKDGGEVLLVVPARGLRLVQQDDLGGEEGDAVLRAQDRAGQREGDGGSAAEDPSIARPLVQQQLDLPRIPRWTARMDFVHRQR